jgi:hypothetical protein
MASGCASKSVGFVGVNRIVAPKAWPRLVYSREPRGF